jgi:hypothetical protein
VRIRRWEESDGSSDGLEMDYEDQEEDHEVVMQDEVRHLHTLIP